MTYSIPQGVQVSLDGTTWYKLSDHNRQPLGLTYTLIEQTDRMANGTLRKYIVAKKFVIKIEWKDFPTLDSNVVDYNTGGQGAAWMKAFYEGNSFNPIYVKLMYALEGSTQNGLPTGSYLDSANTTGDIKSAYMTTFTYDVTKRRAGYDYVNLTIEFTEI